MVGIPLKTVRRRYFLVKTITACFCLNGFRIFEAVKKSLHTLYGESGLALADLHLIETGDDYVVISCDHRMIQQVRSAVAYVLDVGGVKTSLYVVGISGTLKKLRKKFLRRKPSCRTIC